MVKPHDFKTIPITGRNTQPTITEPYFFCCYPVAMFILKMYNIQRKSISVLIILALLLIIKRRGKKRQHDENAKAPIDARVFIFSKRN